MAQCKECFHYGVCAKEGRLVQVDEHTWDEYNLLPNVEQFCTSYFTADVVPKSEVERLRGELARANRILREIKQAHRRCNHWKLAQIIEGDEL